MYGQLDDLVELTAIPKDGYSFAGWYDSDGNRLSSDSEYSYYITGVSTVYAYFTELHYPLVAFVPATEDETLGGRGTHVIQVNGTVEPESALSGTGGVYGNTISTGFITSKDLGENHSYNSCTWNITIPTPTENSPLYIKKTAVAKSDDFVFEETPVIEDKSDVQANKGNIYKVTAFKNNASSMTLNLMDSLPTVVTGGNICYSITLDNIYAPGATAELSGESAGSANDKYIHSGSVDEFKNDKNNKYSSVKQ